MANEDYELSEVEEFDSFYIEGASTALMYLLFKDTELDPDTVYSLVFQNGRKVMWH